MHGRQMLMDMNRSMHNLLAAGFEKVEMAVFGQWVLGHIEAERCAVHILHKIFELLNANAQILEGQSQVIQVRDRLID
jgi:hypothetical protein